MVFGIKAVIRTTNYYEFLDPFVCHRIGFFRPIPNSNNPLFEEVTHMKKFLARYASSALAASAVVFATILKPYIHSPEIPKELRK